MTTHIHPVDDLIEHVLVTDCPCGPTTKVMRRPDGSRGPALVHHSLDGRERGAETTLPAGSWEEKAGT